MLCKNTVVSTAKGKACHEIKGGWKYMPVTYLQYIDSVRRMQNPAPNMQLLVSGADTYVHRVVGGHIIAAAYSRGLPMFIVDNTTGGGG